MNIVELKNNIISGFFDNSFIKLYGNTDVKERFINAVESFTDYFVASEDMRMFSAPGRTEVGGNHTDHEHGCVLTGSVNLDVIAIVSKNNAQDFRNYLYIFHKFHLSGAFFIVIL